MTFAEKIARIYAGRWSTESGKFALPERTTVIMKATHGATCDRLANGSVATAMYAAELNGTKVYFSSYSGNPPGAKEVLLTRKLLPGAVHIGAIPTTSAEATALRAEIDKELWEPVTMAIVTDEFNSCRTKDIYQLFFPRTKIFVAALPIADTFDPESPILNFRNLDRAIWWETLIPAIPFWIMTHTGLLGKRLLVWLSNRVAQTAAQA